MIPWNLMALLKNPKIAKLLINLWPPYIGTGIRVRFIADDWREVFVFMNLGWYNRNYVGSHFGGSLYAMTDPLFSKKASRLIKHTP
jgi:hypothetical protein